MEQSDKGNYTQVNMESPAALATTPELPQPILAHIEAAQ